MLAPHAAALHHDPSRVVAHLFLPGDGPPSSNSRVAEIIARVMAESPADIAATAQRVLADFSARHADAASIFADHARVVGSGLVGVADDRETVLGAAFTAEFAVEGAAVCNPSAVVHPSQSGLQPDELRVAVALRGIGEGHVSSIGFAEAVIGDAGWTFQERAAPLTVPLVSAGEWSRKLFARALEQEQHFSDLAGAILGALPEQFTAIDLEHALAALPDPFAVRRDSRVHTQVLRDVVASAYRAQFAADSPLSARILLPVAPDESRGMEDARFVRFTDADGVCSYRATYTAYDGQDVAPRLITSPDLADFEIHRLAGSGAKNKGMALFPRPVGGHQLAITRLDGENISLARSEDGVTWEDRGVVYRPTEPWELLQLGNCGSPIETARGWLMITHGVGPLRTYSLGALLLDLDDPSRVIARTLRPLLTPEGELEDGYVPRVVYSCGAVVHRDTLWVPVGIGDARIQVYSTTLADLWTSMTSV